MNDTRVWSKRHPFPEDSVYVGRPTRWGNPFKVGRDGSQTDVVAKYARWIAEPARADLRRRVRTELSGKHLVCWCAPPGGLAIDGEPLCHAQVLMSVANSS
jgi:hypothetical protein